MTPEIGTLWRRKLSGRLWRVERVAEGLVEVRLVGGRTDCTATEKAAERELLTEASFLDYFEPGPVLQMIPLSPDRKFVVPVLYRKHGN